ncbi:unnamed protein product, partial [Ixodes hexagonus]
MGKHGPDGVSLTAAQIYEHCTCVDGPTLRLPSGGEYYMAKRDPCMTNCGLIYVYAGAIFIALFFTFLLIVPAMTAMLRSLDEDLKSTGIGVNYVFIRLLGAFAGLCRCLGILIVGKYSVTRVALQTTRLKKHYWGRISVAQVHAYYIVTLEAATSRRRRLLCVCSRDRCGRWGSCAIYENSVMGMNIFQIMISVKSASILFFFCASFMLSQQ